MSPYAGPSVPPLAPLSVQPCAAAVSVLSDGPAGAGRRGWLFLFYPLVI